MAKKLLVGLTDRKTLLHEGGYVTAGNFFLIHAVQRNHLGFQNLQIAVDLLPSDHLKTEMSGL